VTAVKIASPGRPLRTPTIPHQDMVREAFRRGWSRKHLQRNPPLCWQVWDQERRGSELGRQIVTPTDRDQLRQQRRLRYRA
jgi:hypothetical protein